MKYYFKLGAILFLIAAVASGVLAFVNNFTRPIIEENQRRAEDEARREVLPEAAVFKLMNTEYPFYVGFDNEKNIAGYTFIAEEMGYSGVIQTMVGVDPNMRITNIKVIKQSETPGLGANCVRPEFTNQFCNLALEELVLDKDSGSIVTITGATITTRALTSSLQKAIKGVSEELRNLPEISYSDLIEDEAEFVKEEQPSAEEVE
ncbi:MAG: RnfABCDGE type electron transport complex subunit G [Candidatus Cloacimonetes bacterium]|nr:RnfABCDGE type electron transport complex subunit G [Candidatus Cloacimonadota bacterium]